MARRKTTRADVEEEIRRARDDGSSGNPLPEGGACPVDNDPPNLEDADLSGVDLPGSDLGFANLRRADSRGAVLEETNPDNAPLSEADPTGTTRTRGANLTRTPMNLARLEGADLGRAVLIPAHPGFLGNSTRNGSTRWPKGPDRRSTARAAPVPRDLSVNNVARFAPPLRQEGYSGPPKPLFLAGYPPCVPATLR